MEPLSLAATIAKLIFSKVLEKNGKEIGDQLAEAASNKVSQLLNFVREKFQKEGVEGKLNKAQEEPSEAKIKKFESELVDQMSEDEEFGLFCNPLIDISNRQISTNIYVVKRSLRILISSITSH
jgi:hypothetical protein